MRNWLFILILLIPFPAAAAGAKAPADVAKNIRAGIADLKIDTIRTTPMKGVYEIQVRHGKKSVVYYSDGDGKHLIAGGHMFETASHRDLTRERLEDLNRVDWSSLPLDKAIVSGDPKAKLKVAIFTDPDCPFCRKLEAGIKDLKGVKVYSFLFPLTQIHPHSQAKAEAIWCSKDRHDTMMKVMLENANPPVGTCNTPLADIQRLAMQLGVMATPTLISGDGRMTAGGIATGEQLKAWLQKK